MSAGRINFKDARQFLLLVKDATHTEVAKEVVGTGDGATKTFTATIAKTSVEGGSLTVGGDGATESFTDNGDGTLTGSAGGSGTYNTETGALSITFNTAPGLGDDVELGYWYLAVKGSNMVWAEQIKDGFDSDPETQNPSTGGFHGAEPSPGDFWYEPSYMTILSNTTGWAEVDDEVVGTGDNSTTTFSGTLANPGIHSEAYTTPTDGAGSDLNTLLFTDGTESFTDADGDGVLVGDAGGSGTINYATGAWSLVFNAAPGAAQAITCDYTHLPLPECEEAHLISGHARTWTESDTEGYWGYSPTPYAHAEYGARIIREETGGLKALDHRMDKVRALATYKAGVGERIMAELKGFGAARTEPVTCDNPTRGLLPSEPALVNSQAVLTLKVYLTGETQTFTGRLVGAFEVRPPFEVERLDSATGDNSGGTVAVELNAPQGKRAEVDLQVQLTLPGDFNTRRAFIKGRRVDTTLGWKNRAETDKGIRYTCTGYAKKVEAGTYKEVVLAGLKLELMHGLPGDTNVGRDTTLPLGQWQYYVTKPTA
ncbi:MAG: hypothetical protein CMH57_02725 [Myxococcales bacterium]|nr:hypothetical protein [Myxococcales bacterium]